MCDCVCDFVCDGVDGGVSCGETSDKVLCHKLSITRPKVYRCDMVSIKM